MKKLHENINKKERQKNKKLTLIFCDKFILNFLLQK